MVVLSKICASFVNDLGMQILYNWFSSPLATNISASLTHTLSHRIELLNAMAKVLLVDDDLMLSAMIEKSLVFEHYQVEMVHDGEDGLHLLRMNSYDVAIIDFNLPSMSGTEICQQYRAKGGKIPLIMLTARSDVDDKISGLGSGADDYLTKPFAIEELLARIKALLRRADRPYAEGQLKLGQFTLDPSTFRVTKNGEEVRLVRKEFAILELLFRYPGRVFSADEIINRAWTSDDYPTGDVVRSHIRNIRKKLGDEQIIQTLHGVGYKVEPADQ
jgi:DNA-binding response OmpR family regulator